MRTFRLAVATLLLTTVTAISSFAQTQPTQPNRTQTQPNQTIKIGLINTLAFDNSKAGISKYINALNSVDVAFRKELDELNALAVKIQNLEKELTGLQSQLASNSASVPVNKTQLQASYSTKAEEYEKSGREFKFKQDDLKSRYQRRRQEVVGPILLDIGKAMQDFAKQRGFSLILDGAKLEEGGVLLAIGDEKIDVTKDFITFYNARPATAAVTPPTK